MTPLEARCTNYEEGIHDVVEGLKTGSMPLEEAVNLLQGLLDAPAEEHLRALRHFEEGVAGILAFKTRVLRQIPFPCPLCHGETVHTGSCLLSAAIQAQAPFLEGL